MILQIKFSFSDSTLSYIKSRNNSPTSKSRRNSSGDSSKNGAKKVDSRENSPKKVGYRNSSDSAKSKIIRSESPRLKDIGWGFGGKGNGSAKSNVLRSEFRAKSRQSVRSSRSSRSVDSAGSDKRRSTDSAGSYKRYLCIMTFTKITVFPKHGHNVD